ncbi:MAG: hypothetical protein ABMA15_28340 [Vicinamibacterales bacterium]
MAELSIVRYEPDKGAAFGHPIRPAALPKALSAIQSFLDLFADSATPSSVRLVAYQATDWDDPKVIAPLLDAVTRRFGPPASTTGGGMNISTGIPMAGGYIEWRGDEKRWSEFAQFVINGAPWPKTTLGPISARASFRFQWKAELTSADRHVSWCDLKNEMDVSIERASFVQPRFWFPFEPGSSELVDLVRRVAAGAPFRMSARHFRAATPKKDGHGYVLRRFDAASLFAA